MLVSGTLHVQNHLTINDNRLSLKIFSQPMGATGVGQTTGDTYHATGVMQVQNAVAITNGAREVTFVNNFLLIGEGPDNNLLVQQIIQVTIDANSFIRSNVINTSVECR